MRRLLHRITPWMTDNDITVLRSEIANVRNDCEALRKLIKGYLPKRKYESFDVSFLARFRAGMTSADYFNRHLYSKPLFPDSEALLIHCVGLLNGDVRFPLEFGVFSGKSINIIAKAAGENTIVYGFDSFEGLPEDWRSNFGKGRFAVENLPQVEKNVVLVKGWFDETLPSFKAEALTGQKINFLHIDCDLYSSTKTIFDELSDVIADDAVIVFDEFFNYPGWEQHEIKAFHEFIDASGRTYEHIGCVPTHQQVAIRLTSR